MNEEYTWTVSPETYAATRDKIKKVNERAIKKGFTGRIELEVEGPKTLTHKNILGFEIEEIVYEIKLTGEPPKYEGWKLLATLDWDEEAGLIVRTAPGVERVDRAGLKEGWCDHCKTKRHRTNTYLVQHDDGRQVQVGSTCIKDFLGWQGRIKFVSTDEIKEDLDDDFGSGGFRIDPSWSTETVLAVAWAVIKAYGYKPASSYDGSTKELVFKALDPRNKVDREFREEIEPYIAESADIAHRVREWVLSDEFKGDSEYVWNLKAIARADYTTYKNVGFLASAPQAWAKAQDRDLVRRKERAEIKNEFIGEVGEKLTGLKVKIKSLRFLESDWGSTALYTMVSTSESSDGGNHVFKWFASRPALGERWDDDQVFTIKGTVKKHDEYHDMKSTVLTRVKEVEE